MPRPPSPPIQIEPIEDKSDKVIDCDFGEDIEKYITKFMEVNSIPLRMLYFEKELNKLFEYSIVHIRLAMIVYYIRALRSPARITWRRLNDTMQHVYEL